MYIATLEDRVNKYSNIYRRIIKVKPVHVISNTYINSNKEVNDKDPTFKIDDIVRISKYKNIFTKGYVPTWTLVKNTVPWAYVIIDYLKI